MTDRFSVWTYLFLVLALEGVLYLVGIRAYWKQLAVFAAAGVVITLVERARSADDDSHSASGAET